MNKLHVITRPYVVQRELLFKQGEPYDSAVVAESERNLRNLLVFREVHIDTTHIGQKFAVVVRTQDGWSTKPKFKFAVASDGTFIFTVGITEANLLGTANLVHISYSKDVDRSGLQIAAQFRRFISAKLTANGAYYALSDGDQGNWNFGKPFRSSLSANSLMYDGLAADRRIIQFFAPDATSDPDSTFFQRLAFINRLDGAIATKRAATRYLRVGITGEVRDEQYLPQPNTAGTAPDSVYGQVGAYASYTFTEFREVRRFNGFGSEDIDLSRSIKLTANLAPGAWGYGENGIGPGITAQGAFVYENSFIWGSLEANGLFSEAELDSGRVVANVAFGYKLAPRHAMALQVQAGILDNPPPGQQFDLGFENPPRAWNPHSFVGDRTLWATFEHRWFVWDKLLGLFGAGFAVFADYGGAWYHDIQDPRFGGNVGIGLRLGSALSTVARTGRLDLAYKFGDGLSGDRWALSFGSGFVFPIKRPMVASDPTNKPF
ncbi:MAG: hypothetical protein V3U38_06185 [Gemmatimonadota bacterium]